MKKRRKARLTKPKNMKEIMNTEKAVSIVGKVLREMCSPFGRSEREVASEIRKRIYASGATLAFMPIVASGRNSMHVHHKPGSKIVREDEPVIFDLGAKYRGCCSDITRMHIPNDGRYKRIRKIFSHALQMQKMVIARARPGIEMKDLQEIYKNMMKKRRYKVMHSIGHGIGSNVHENVKGGLKPGMVFTVEPGIYIRDFGGCRVEDMVIVTKYGSKVMSRSIPLQI